MHGFPKKSCFTIEKVNPLLYDKIMEWKKIKKFENYSVSNTGLIMNNKTGSILKTTIKKKRSLVGYELVYLYNKEGRKCLSVHRLVALAFIPNPKNYPQINHKDENSLNNNVDNLEWCTLKYNANYGSLKERKRQQMLQNNPFKGKKHSKQTIEIMRAKKIGLPSKCKKKVVINGVKYESVSKAMKELHLSTRAFYKILKKEGK